ncbi:MAG: thymidine phosphorylase [Treponema sp.]|nr:thymidine phosphorylase [Treponema sp.]
MKKRGTFVTLEDGTRKLLNGEGQTQTLTKEEIDFMIKGCVDGSIPQYQMSAWLMSIFFNSMTFEETGYLTQAMLYSGDVIDLHKRDNQYPNFKDTIFVDKHSTGGVGDKLSLPLAPIVAACGLKVPMMSGRALGHTGGTLDKLDSVNGYKTRLEEDDFAKLISKTGFAMTGQTDKIAPADKILYSLRDVTGTVESIPLITASILSKKCAEGSDGLVFDVKYGSGAFMKSIPDAEQLANFLVNTAKSMGKKASALITDMNTPLGNKIGNFLEIEETVQCLQNQGPEDVMEVTYALGAEMLVMGKIASTTDEGLLLCKQAVESGKALKLFLQNIDDQGGNSEELMSQLYKRRSPHKIELRAIEDGYIFIDAYKTGLSGITLGVGRNKTTDSVCPDAGIILHAKTGNKVSKGDLIMEIFGKDDDCLQPALESLKSAVSYSKEPLNKNKLIYKKIQ